MITILDYGIGNLGSVRNMLRRAGQECEITADPAVVDRAQKIILPGVGAFDRAMTRLNESGLRPVLDRKALEEKIPVLGICLGMQMLTKGSEEGDLPGLGYIPAFAYRFPADSVLKVPHMGWNRVVKAQSSQLTDSLPDDSRFYFVHSYYVRVEDEANALLKCRYGVGYDAAIIKDNVFGAQFHPEKSHKFGRALFAAFGAI
jgi:imidazole glycerol-phosphate synthase subunit HisH